MSGKRLFDTPIILFYYTKKVTPGKDIKTKA